MELQQVFDLFANEYQQNASLINIINTQEEFDAYIRFVIASETALKFIESEAFLNIPFHFNNELLLDLINDYFNNFIEYSTVYYDDMYLPKEVCSYEFIKYALENNDSYLHNILSYVFESNYASMDDEVFSRFTDKEIIKLIERNDDVTNYISKDRIVNNIIPIIIRDKSGYNYSTIIDIAKNYDYDLDIDEKLLFEMDLIDNAILNSFTLSYREKKKAREINE